jgi:multiple sugar transport system substrate-binding protein
MKRVAAALVLVGALAVSAGLAAAAPKGHTATKLTVWVGWSARELSEFNKVVAEYDKKNPNVEVKVVGGINDDKIIAAIRAGNAPDVVSSFTSSNVGIYCSSGGWLDLAPYMKKSGISADIFPKTAQYYTQYKGTRCALPLLADAYGFYYNKKLFAAAGIAGPPKTMTELAADAKKLTKRNADGSLKVVGYDPEMGFYQNTAGAYQPLFNGKYFDSDGHSSLGSDPKWAAFLRWQKSLIDFYGSKNLVKWQTGAGDEFSASNAFESGKLAMLMDGEWRVAFIKAEHPTLSYGTAPMPTMDPSLYGAGYINGTIIGIPKNGHNHDQAWDLVKYLTTNDHALAEFSNGIRNVPSTKSSTTSKELIPDPNFATFGRIFTNPHSQTIPITPAGAAHLDTLQTFIASWQAGRVKDADLTKGLKDVDKQIDAKLKQAGAGGGGAP